MLDDGLINTRLMIDIENISEFTDAAGLEKIINKLTDYADFISEGKIAGLINYKYNLNSTQTNRIINLLLNIQAVSKIYNIASKGLKDLEIEYVSNIFSETIYPNNLSPYISLRNAVENRLNHQIQQYNINMGKSNTTLTMPINELKGHIKTYTELSKANVSVSTKAHHGYISSSLHDAYIILINQPGWMNDKTYMKYFLNDGDIKRNDLLLISNAQRQSLSEISENIQQVMGRLIEAHESRIQILKAKDNLDNENHDANEKMKPDTKDRVAKNYNDKMLQTPFGKQYGGIIDKILSEIFNKNNKIKYQNIADEIMRDKILPLYGIYIENSNNIKTGGNIDDIYDIVDYLINISFGIKSFTEKFIYNDKKVSFKKYYTDATKVRIEDFITELFIVFVEAKFRSLYRFIKSLDMKKFACAYMIKRIYIREGENLTIFGFYLIKTIGKIGGIKT